MLSAIAARKAAQAALRDATVPMDSQPGPTTSAPVLEAPTPKKPTSKRKSSTQTSKPPKRKKEKPKAPPRYFDEPDSFQDQDDVIVIDSDSDEVDEQEDFREQPPMKRRWSPSLPLNDSSDEGDMDADLDVSFSVLPTTAVPKVPTTTEVLSTFHPSPNQNTFFLDVAEVSALQLESNAPGTLIALHSEETICLLGTYTFTVLQGSINHSGVLLSPSRRCHRVFAPRSSPLPLIEGQDSARAIQNIRNLPQSIHPLIARPITLVLLQELHSGVEGLGRICRTFDGVFAPSRWQRSTVSDELQLSGVHLVCPCQESKSLLTVPQIQSQTRDIQPFELSPSWSRAIASSTTADLTQASVHLIKGPKNSGKSSFARTLVNNLLKKYHTVAYLDCDLGQSEFTPGGMVSLNLVSRPIFGPPFTHPTLPHAAHYIGAATPRATPALYLAAIQALLETYRLDIQVPADLPEEEDDEEEERIVDAIPLVINTMGWTKGLGADLTRSIQEMAAPSDVYELDATYAPPPPTHAAPGAPAHRQHLLQPIPPSVLATAYTAADYRALNMLSYFHAVFPPSAPSTSSSLSLFQDSQARTWQTTLPLRAVPPYAVSTAQALDAVILVGAGSEDVVPEEIGRVLNGAIVGLVECIPGTLDVGPKREQGPPYTQAAAPPPPTSSGCVGVALVRAVSPQETELHVITPLPHHLLTRSRVLVKGELELPVWGMLDFREVGEEQVPYLQWGKSEGLGGQRRRVRRNLMRKGQM
ncbi:hypothetical protein H0H81_003675 [Sphagnurus paluster]|uniref:Polynucleotide 5'-hydroxyl-kinase GRC3 n=1 Tax=Sphagnurus paluster TaxID=117069 RepID=A0A9P7GM43_9AGAR|nr:hypothetical protein H0H81_003675 [Sphagnurus paluster]